MTFGSYEWARRADGNLTRAEKLAETFRGALAVLRARAARLTGRRARAVTLALGDIPQPRTAVTGAALAALDGAEPWVLPHSMRAYLFAWLFGLRDGLRPDAEILLAAALLHDVGLVRTDGAACFAYRGALEARAIVQRVGASPAATDRIADAICMHLCVTAHGAPEVVLLRAGTAYDVVGARFGDIGRVTRRAILAVHPRAGLVAGVGKALRAEAENHPRTRAALLYRDLGFMRLVSEGDARFTKEDG